MLILNITPTHVVLLYKMQPHPCHALNFRAEGPAHSHMTSDAMPTWLGRGDILCSGIMSLLILCWHLSSSGDRGHIERQRNYPSVNKASPTKCHHCHFGLFFIVFVPLCIAVYLHVCLWHHIPWQGAMKLGALNFFEPHPHAQQHHNTFTCRF